MEKICVIGLGYIGLPTACMLANAGYDVLGIDINKEIIDKLNSGKSHIDEPELHDVFEKAFGSKKLRISQTLEGSDIFIISVPTPLGENDKSDLSYVVSATRSVCEFISAGNLVILESTSPPLTTEKLVGGMIFEKNGMVAGKDYNLAFCPERVLPGNLIYEFINNDRIIGGIDKTSAERAKKIYRSFSKGQIFLTDLKTAEFVKLAENTYRDINIAFSNELSDICEDYGIDIWEVVELANKHPRVNILKPGPGVGGHCIPIDPWFILENINKKNSLIEKSRNINDNKPIKVAKNVIEHIKGIENPKVTLFGAAYKEDIEDTRESPTIAVLEELEKNSIKVNVYDPVAKNFKYKLCSFADSLKDSDALVMLVSHKVFKNLEIGEIKVLMRNKIIFDTRNFYKREEVESIGFAYFRI